MEHDSNLLARNLRLLKLLQIDVWIFISAIFVVYQMHIVGLTLAQVFIGEAVFAGTILLFEVPTSAPSSHTS